MVWSMNSPSGIVRGSSLLFNMSVCTHGGASFSTLTGLSRKFQRGDIVYECSAALVDEYMALIAIGTKASTDATLMMVAAGC